MKLKKHINYKSNNQVWRILISAKNHLIVENRNTELKQVYFNCFDLQAGKKVFVEKQFDETYWIGIEKVVDDIIFFHGFAKPDMPGHKGISAFSIDEQKIIWKNNQYTFLFLYQDKIYCFVQKFEGRDYYVVDSKTGEFIEQVNLSDEEINQLRRKAAESENYSDYLFPIFQNESSEKDFINIISDFTKSRKIIGDIEYVHYKDLLIFNFHEEISKNNLINNLICFEISKKKIFLKEIINVNVAYPAPDSFFIYKNFLIFVKDKMQVFVYKIEQ